MSNLRREDQNDLQGPSVYAPRWLREQPELRSTFAVDPLAEADPEPDEFSFARARELDPEVMPEPPKMDRGRDWRSIAGFAGRVALAVVISGVAALFFVITTAKQNAGSSQVPALDNSTTAMTSGNPAANGLKSALAELRGLVATSNDANRNAAPRQSDQLLQPFLAWREKTNLNEPPQ